MSQSLSKIYVHAVFHIKHNSPEILANDIPRLNSYIATIQKDHQCVPINTNGIYNHIHTLFILSKNHSIAKIMQLIKGNSSRWIKSLSPHYENFAWQGGYGSFSVSHSVVNKISHYIAIQEAHHNKQDTQQEYFGLLDKHELKYDPDYLWE